MPFNRAENVSDAPRLSIGLAIEAGAETKVNSGTGGTSNPSVTVLADGGWVVTWEDIRGDGTADIYQRVFDANGGAIGATDTRVDSALTGTRFLSSVTALSGGGWVVTWQDSRNSGNYDIYQRVFDANGQALGSADTQV